MEAVDGGGSSDGEEERKQQPYQEDDGGGGGGGGEPRVKRKMKTPAQLEALERTYQRETYPSEALRAELSAQLGLTDRQLQMWFCHRRLKDRKGTTTNTPAATPAVPSTKRPRKAGDVSPATATPPPLPPPIPSSVPAAPLVKDEVGGGDFGNEHGSASGSGSSPYKLLDTRRNNVSRTGVAVPRKSHGRYYEPPAIELRAIKFIEAQLGEPLREDGPALGVEFDPLPPGAFGTPIDASEASQKHVGPAYDPHLYERADVKPIKGSGRAVHEYQFLPEQPTVRTDSYERLAQSHYYGSPSDGPSSRARMLSSGRSYVHGGEEVPGGYNVQGQVPSLSLIQQGKQGHHVPSMSTQHDSITRKGPYMSAADSPFSAHPIAHLDGALASSERCIIYEEDAARVERKRKSEEARIAKEVEAHEKRIRKELEKQDILRQKKEEQMKKEMERQDRERRKEEERLLREKQREEERFQREKKREMERHEKYLLKESIRAEKMRQKEELRREKEAARQKAANDRAAARRIAKESMELIEDERLELMEIAASRKGLSSILALDSDTLQNLESFRDALSEFPPNFVQLKRPLAAQPWTDNESNVGNLLMAWKFLITFTDVLGLWPFTLDEFVQAFHDYDPRLLSEIHIALLRSIIKDIEDVARTPSTGLGVNQYSAPSGGHSHIVEGAYAWGFDIRSWQRHLSPLTWPEILRQFALSAGLGPKLKKRNVEPTYLCDDNEDNDGLDIISNLRTGVTVENAVAILQERGYSNQRRSRHRLTPGTVKFAAFHVLSLEGSKGLNILEVADRIQKSGLRDLTTSKTPEASIAAALSRDTKLFERVAPSTYCVRSPYRKDPADSEAILSSAREKIRIAKWGLVNEGETEDVEKDDDSESDVVEDPEVDDLGAELVINKEVGPSYEVDRSEERVCPANGLVAMHDVMLDETQDNNDEALPLMHAEDLKDLKNTGACVSQSADIRVLGHDTTTDIDQEDTEIDESCHGEPWVQGLTEGDYSNLSVEERLNALVALIAVATEGNSIRVVLEERLEAANTLKKQMWAEAQIDKRRMKEEFSMKSQYATSSGNKMEPNAAVSAAESRRSPLLASEDKTNQGLANSAPQPEVFHTPQHDRRSPVDLPSEKNLVTPDFSAGQENIALQQSVYAAERSRAQLKAYIGHKAEKMYVYRSLPLGMDRRRNRYWQFTASASSSDPGTGRVFVELQNGCWRLIDSEKAFDALLSSLDVRGVRESHLHVLLQKIEPSFKEAIRMKQLGPHTTKQCEDHIKTETSEIASHADSYGGTDSPSSTVSALNSDAPQQSSSFRIELGRNKLELNNILRRYIDFEEWMWKECFPSRLCAVKHGKKRCTQLLGTCDNCHDLYFFEDQYCSTCHKPHAASGMDISSSEHSDQYEDKFKYNHDWKLHGLDSLHPLRIRLLKAQLSLVEVSIPPEALRPDWSDFRRKSWGRKLLKSSSAEELLQALTMLESAVKRENLSSNFQTTSEFLVQSNASGGGDNVSFNPENVMVLPWVPLTTAAVALRLMELDSAISYLLHQKPESEQDAEAGEFMNHPSKYSVVRNIQDYELGASHGGHLRDDLWGEPENGGLGSVRTRGGRARGRGRSRGGRSQRLAVSGGRRGGVTSTSERLGPVVGGWKGRSRGKGGRRRGRRSARSRQKSVKKVGTIMGKRDNIPEPPIFDRSPGALGREQWNSEETMRMQAGNMVDESNSERSESEDYNGQASGAEYGDAVDDYVGVYNGRSAEFLEVSDDENVEGDEEGDDHDEVGEDDEDEELDLNSVQYEQGDEEVAEYDDQGYDGAGYEHGDAAGYEQYEQGDMDVDGFLNADSDDENEDGVRGHNEDQYESSSSASTDYSDDDE